MSVHDRLRQSRRARREQHPQRMIVLDALVRERRGVLRRMRHEVVPRDRLGERRSRAGVQIRQPHDGADRRQRGEDRLDLGAAVVVFAREAVAVGDEEHRRIDLREAVDHGARAELGRRRRPDRADRDRRQHGHDRLRDVRHVRGDAVSRPHAERAQLRREHAHRAAELLPRHLGERAELRAVHERRLAGPGTFLVAQQVFGVVDARAAEPHGARHRALVEHAFVRLRRAHLEEVPHLGPEADEVGHRPLPQLVVGREVQTAFGEPPHEACDGRRLRGRGIGRPQQLAFGHAKTFRVVSNAVCSAAGSTRLRVRSVIKPSA